MEYNLNFEFEMYFQTQYFFNSKIGNTILYSEFVELVDYTIQFENKKKLNLLLFREGNFRIERFVKDQEYFIFVSIFRHFYPIFY